MTTASSTKPLPAPTLQWNPLLSRTFHLRSGRKSWHIAKSIVAEFDGKITSDRKYGPKYCVRAIVDPTKISEFKQQLYTEMTIEGYQYDLVTSAGNRVTINVDLKEHHPEINTFNSDFFPAV